MRRTGLETARVSILPSGIRVSNFNRPETFQGTDMMISGEVFTFLLDIDDKDNAFLSCNAHKETSFSRK
ncbi:hypothetical protein QWZ16_17455 [Vibrio ostreicida]|uniref:Uncharacterized protein n=1 Tax=Vibrio ostreicida TaxID=526588 RepID=A0ABT8BYC2_9VIBR|nr:hypothetical protein [Vibrio ostreicida]MDN3611391.1 hypothetical protein [Vibrio ostreicida]